jgi:hypothetical protein
MNDLANSLFYKTPDHTEKILDSLNDLESISIACCLVRDILINCHDEYICKIYDKLQRRYVKLVIDGQSKS